jgi:predicted lipoprotein
MEHPQPLRCAPRPRHRGGPRPAAPGLPAQSWSGRRGVLWAALAAVCLAPLAPSVHAATPGNATTAFVEGVLRQQVLPQLQGFSRAAAALVATCERWSTRSAAQRAPARLAWQDALVAWARLSTLLVGPLVERRSPRRIDFAPTRALQVLQAIERNPRSAEDMERIGAAAKGFGALEWLLWDPKAPGDEDARRYAVMLAREIAAEAEALSHDFAQMLARPRTSENTRELLAQILNQWVGGAEQLRMQGLQRPSQGADGKPAAPLPRALSGAAAAERQARWQVLAAVLVPPGDPPPAWNPGVSSPTLDQLLQAEGHEALANNLRAAVPRADAALRDAAGNQKPAMQAAARTLAVLKGVVEFDAAPALDVQIGFSDSDGD